MVIFLRKSDFCVCQSIEITLNQFALVSWPELGSCSVFEIFFFKFLPKKGQLYTQKMYINVI